MRKPLATDTALSQPQSRCDKMMKTVKLFPTRIRVPSRLHLGGARGRMRLRLLSPPTLFRLPQLPQSPFFHRLTPAPPPIHVRPPARYIRSDSRTYNMTPCSPTPKKILVFGSGNFGSCLADHLGDSEHEVSMWSREKSFVEFFNEHHKNPRYLKDHCFPRTIRAVGPDLPDANIVKQMDVLLFAIPTQGLRYRIPLHTAAKRAHVRVTLGHCWEDYVQVLTTRTFPCSYL
jgi:hypothetical protein